MCVRACVCVCARASVCENIVVVCRGCANVCVHVMVLEYRYVCDCLVFSEELCLWQVRDTTMDLRKTCRLDDIVVEPGLKALWNRD
jgi:hypothetical protein